MRPSQTRLGNGRLGPAPPRSASAKARSPAISADVLWLDIVEHAKFGEHLTAFQMRAADDGL